MTDKYFERYTSGLKKIKDHLNKLDVIISTKILEPFDEPRQLSHTKLSSSIEPNKHRLYEEVLKVLLHTEEDKSDFNQSNIISYVQKVFDINQMNHDAIYKSIIKNKAPNTILNVEIVEGKNLKSNDVNSFLNPFCTLFISSRLHQKYNTSLKSKTLQPVWKEHFSLPLENPDVDTLFVEIWDSKPTKTFIEKIYPIEKLIKIEKYLPKILSENIKCKNEIIGITQVSLKKIISKDNGVWYNLEIEGQQLGNLLIKLSLECKKNKQVTTQEYRHLLRVLIAHQIKVQGIRTHSWTGDFLPRSKLIIEHYITQNDISLLDKYLCHWVEFINVHMLIPVVNFKVFSDILQNLIEPMKAGKLSSEELLMFWRSTKQILPCCYNVIRTIRQKSSGDKKLLNQIENTLNILQLVQSLNVRDDLDLFPSDIYHWLLPCKHKRDVKITLHDVVIKAAVDWYEHILKKINSQVKTEEEKLKLQLYIIRFLRLDLQNAIQYYDKIFIEKIEFQYASTIFSVYDSIISERYERLMECICANIKSAKFEKKKQLGINYDPFTPGTSFFVLYIEIQQLFNLGIDNCSIHQATSYLSKYHLWIHQGVVMWLDIVVDQAMECIQKAVESDSLIKVHSSDYSSSAEDTLVIFRQIITFWQKLAWPDVEGSYLFVEKIINGICKCSEFYSDKMSYKVSKFVNEYKRFDVIKEWCLGINNIDHIKCSIRQCIHYLKLEKLMESLKSDIDADHCRRKIESIIDDTNDNLNEKTRKLFQVFCNKIYIEMCQFLFEVENNIPMKDKIDSSKQYLDKCFRTLKNELNAHNFLVMLNVTADKITGLIFILIKTNLLKKKLPSYFEILRCRFNSLFEFLFDNYEEKPESLKKLETLIMLPALSTEDLIEYNYLQRLKEQKETKESNEGFLTVTLVFINNVLRIKILNEHCFEFMDSRGLSDPSVTIRLVPSNKFQNIFQLRTKIQKKSLYPFDDNYLRIPLTYKQRTDKNGIVMFNIEDRNLSGVSNEFISETFIHFKDIPFTMLENNICNEPQFKLNLTVPKVTDLNVLEILESRSTDELANDFVSREKVKFSGSNKTEKNISALLKGLNAKHQLNWAD